MSYYLTIYCDSEHCVVCGRSSAELEMPDKLGHLGQFTVDIQEWAESNLQKLGWGKESTGGHLCPECLQREEEAEFLRVCPPVG